VKNKVTMLQVCTTVCIAMLRNVGTVTATAHSDISEHLHLQQCGLSTQISRVTYLAACPVTISVHNNSRVRGSGFETYTFKFLRTGKFTVPQTSAFVAFDSRPRQTALCSAVLRFGQSVYLSWNSAGYVPE
jgi:hypothetical protein